MKKLLPAKSLAIIGAGPSGLATIKAADEEGIASVAFEAAPACGGVWNESHGLVWPSLRANLSKFSCGFSDFPPAPETSLFPTATEMASYLRAYVKHFNLDSRIRFSSRVVSAKPTSSGWQLVVDAAGKYEMHHVDALVVASGIFSAAAFPNDCEMSGVQVSHVSAYKTPDPFKNKRVLVVGAAFSGADIAAEISAVAMETAIVVRRPSWYLPRLIPDGTGRPTPLDLLFYSRRSAAEGRRKDPIQSAHDRHAYFTSIVGDQGQLHPQLAVKDDGASAPVVVSDALPTAIRSGRLRILAPADVDLSQMRWRSGRRRASLDAIVYATGYKPQLEYLDAETLKAVEYNSSDLLQPLILAKAVFPLGRGDKLGFVGVYRGPYFATVELQARLVCATFAGRIPPLSIEELKTEIKMEKDIRSKHPRPQFPHADYVGMCDDIAGHLGVMPNLSPRNPLYNSLYNGPLLPGHFRLEGRHSNPEIANGMIENVERFLGRTLK